MQRTIAHASYILSVASPTSGAGVRVKDMDDEMKRKATETPAIYLQAAHYSIQSPFRSLRTLFTEYPLYSQSPLSSTPSNSSSSSVAFGHRSRCGKGIQFSNRFIQK